MCVCGLGSGRDWDAGMLVSGADYVVADTPR